MCLSWKDSEESCRCRMAVVRAYAGMIDASEPETTAREAALRVFQWHHPDVEPAKRVVVVAHWLDRKTLH